jgi:Glycosyltransferase sugar-binding region containing DXD motif
MPIPHVIHQIWLQGEDKIPDRERKWMESIKKNFNPSWEHKIWCTETVWPLLSDRMKEIWEKAPSFSCKSDLARIAILSKFGGLYLDTDYLVLKDFSFLFTDDIECLLVKLEGLKPYERHYNNFNTAVMACAPGFSMFVKWLDFIESIGPFGSSQSKTYSIAKEYTEKVTAYHRLEKFLLEEGYHDRADVRIISGALLEPLSFNNQHLKCTDIETCHKNFPIAFGIHLTVGSWMPNKTMLDSLAHTYGCTSDWAPILMWVFIVVSIFLIIVVVYLSFKLRRCRADRVKHTLGVKEING